MKYSLTRQTKNPCRAYQYQAGIDIFVPKFTEQFISEMYKINDKDCFCIRDDYICIYTHSRIKLLTGVYFNIPQDHALFVLQKTSIPYETGIISGARVIDSSYQGQFVASLINTSEQCAYLQEGQKFIQLVLVPISNDYQLQQIEHDKLYQGYSQRNTGGYGSTGMF